MAENGRGDHAAACPHRKNAHRILTWIAADPQGRATFSHRDLHRGITTKTLRTATDLDLPLALLTDHGYLQETTTHSNHRRAKGRPPTRYHTHPAFLSDPKPFLS